MYKPNYLIMAIILAIMSMISCDKTNNPTTPVTDPLTPETVAQEISQNYSGSDLIFNFDNGIKISLKSADNANLTNGKIAIKLLKNENYFNTPNDIVLDFSQVAPDAKFNLEYNLKSNLVKEDISIIKYSTANSKEKLNADIVEFEYTASTGMLSLNVDKLGTLPNGKSNTFQSSKYDRLVISWADREKLSEGDEEVTMKVPYYEQIGGSCWAACAAMITAAYPKDNDEYRSKHRIIEIVKYMEHSTFDEGIGLWDFKKNLPSAINIFSTTKSSVSTFVSKSNMLDAILKNIKERKPSIMNLSYPGVGRHAIMVLGYKREQVSLTNIKLKLLIHNPQNLGDESMYKWVDWDWLMKEKGLTEAYQILTAETPLSNPKLQTIGIPINNQIGDLNFAIGSNTKNYKISLIYNANNKDSYDWTFPNSNICDMIPDSVYKLSFKLPVYNADKTPKNINFKVKIINNKTNKYVIEEEDNNTISVGTNDITGEIPLTSIIGKEQFEGTLYIAIYDDNGKFLDGYNLKFKIEPTISKIISFSLIGLKGSYDNKTVEIGSACNDVRIKGNGIKYEGYFETTTDVMGLEFLTQGKINIEFDKEINPTMAKKIILERTMKGYYENKLSSTSITKLILSNVKLDITPITTIKGSEVCKYIDSYTLQTTDHSGGGAGSYNIDKVTCDDKSELWIIIK